MADILLSYATFPSCTATARTFQKSGSLLMPLSLEESLASSDSLFEVSSSVSVFGIASASRASLMESQSLVGIGGGVPMADGKAT